MEWSHWISKKAVFVPKDYRNMSQSIVSSSVQKSQFFEERAIEINKAEETGKVFLYIFIS